MLLSNYPYHDREILSYPLMNYSLCAYPLKDSVFINNSPLVFTSPKLFRQVLFFVSSNSLFAYLPLLHAVLRIFGIYFVYFGGLV